MSKTKFKKTDPLVKDGSANRYREFHWILNPDNVITTREVFEKNGKWSKTKITYFYKPPLYIITYYHSTHPGSGNLRVIKWDGSKEEKKGCMPRNYHTLLALYSHSDYFDPDELDEELIRYQDKIREYIKEYIPGVYKRSQDLGFL
jgi:hypothetical protein